MSNSEKHALVREQNRVGSESLESHVRDDVYTLFMPVSAGGVRSYRDGKKLFHGNLVPGMLRLSGPDERFQGTVTGPITFIELLVPGSIFRKAFTDANYLWPSGSQPFAPLIRPNRTVASIAEAFRSVPSESHQRQAYIDGLTQALLAWLADSQHLKLRFDQLRSRRPLSHEQFTRRSDYADENIGEKLSLEQWAAILNMPAGDFAQAFRKKTRQSPYSWFLDRRIEHAKTLLREQRHSLTDIAQQTGFCSQSHFTHTFHQRVGCSPARWVALSSHHLK